MLHNGRLVLLIILLINTSAIVAEVFGTIAGRVTDNLGDPVSGYHVVVLDTEYTSISDSLGEYSIDLPQGTYSVQVFGEAYGSTFGRVSVLTNRTTPMYFYIQFAHLGRYEWPAQSDPAPDSEIEMYVTVTTQNVVSLKDFCLFYNGQYYPVEWLSSNVFRIRMPLNDEHITWYLPALSERRIETDSSLFDFSTYIDPVADEITPSIELADLSALLKVSGDAYDEYIQPGYELDRTVINLWDWGHPDLEKAGAVEARVCFNETTSGAEWKALLLFHEKAVVLEENSEPTIFDLCVKTTRCVISENARFVVAYEAVGNAYRGGDAVFLDTETGESIRFDPSPDRIYMDPYVVHSEVMISFGFRTIGHISNEGIFNRIDDYTYELQTFDNEMSIIRTISFEDIDFNPGEGDVISADGSRTLVIGEINDIRYMVFYDEAGIVYSIKPFPHGPVDISEKSVTTDREMSVVLITGSGETGWIDFPYSGTYLIDGITGEILQNWHENENTREPVISPNGEIAAHIVRFPETSYWRELLEIRDLSSGEIVFDYLREDEDVWSIRRVSELADNGNALIRLVKGGWARHALIDRNGSLLWASPVRTTRRSYVDLIHLSDDGYSLAYCDDYSLNIIRLKTESGI